MRKVIFATLLLTASMFGQSTNMGPIKISGNGTGGVGTANGGALNIQKASSPSAIYLARAVDAWGNTNNQLIGFNVEQMVNPTASASYFNAAYTGELFVPIGNTQNFTGTQAGADFAFINYGSGTFSGNQGVGVIGEAWNSGPATSILELDGVYGGCHNGSVSAGMPVQTPTGNGSVTNCRALTASVTNSSTGVITNAEGVYINSTTNTGGGSVTNNYGLNIADQTAGSSNWAVKTGLGLVQFGDNLRLDKLFSMGAAANTSIGMLVQPTTLTGTTQMGIRVLPPTTSSATVFGIGVYGRADTANASYTQADNAGLYAANPSKGASSTITRAYGIYVEPITSGATNFAIKTNGTAISEFDGGVQIGASGTGVTQFQMKNGVAGCATAASAGATCTTVVTWPAAFADNGYIVNCLGSGLTSGVPMNGGLTARSTTTVTFQTVAGTAGAAQYTTIECTAWHP